MQVLCVLMSVGGVTLVSFYSNADKDCQGPSQNHNHTQTSNDSYHSTLDHMVSHLNPKGVTCNTEPSTPLGYVVRSLSPLLPSLSPRLIVSFSPSPSLLMPFNMHSHVAY